MYYDYYDIIHENYDYTLDIQFLINYLKSYDINPRRVLEIGCGTGKHTVLLSRSFSSVYAIDQDPEMILRATHYLSQQNIQNVHLFHSSAENLLSLRLAPFSCTCAFFNVINYILDVNALNQFFRAVSTSITTSGMYFFDCLDARQSYKPKALFEASYGKGEHTFFRRTTSTYNSKTQMLHVSENYYSPIDQKPYICQQTYKIWGQDELTSSAQAFGFQTLVCQAKVDIHPGYQKKNQFLFIMQKEKS